MMSGVLFEKLIVAQLVKKLLAFNKTLSFIIVFTRNKPVDIQSQVNPVHILTRSILTLSSHLRLGLSVLFRSGLQNRRFYAFLFSLKRATCPAHLILLVLITLIIFDDYKL